LIAADTSTLSAYLRGETGADVQRLDEILGSGALVLPPVVLTEILTDPKLSSMLQHHFKALQLLEILEGFWERAGNTRRQLLSLGLKAKLADTLIAQSCIDHGAALITRDDDFRHFAAHCGLKLD
jgi:predicted nucleic acid-binding protein